LRFAATYLHVDLKWRDMGGFKHFFNFSLALEDFLVKLVLNLVLVGGKCFVELIFTFDFSCQLLLTLCCYLDQMLQLVCEYLLIFLKHINFYHPNLLHVVLLHLLQL
jgi:hypothetical protein